MVFPLDISQKGKKTDCQRAMIVEIVGPAGAGKTTLFRALEKLDPGFRVEFLPPVWDPGYTPFFVKHILHLTPTLARMLGNSDRNLTRRELAWMAMLEGWPEILNKKAEGDCKAILLDQGPIFLMTILYEFGPSSLQKPVTQAFWNEVTHKWFHTLDGLICLDALDEILITRIRTRQDDHIAKDKPDQEIKDFLAKYRRSYQRLISTMTTNNHQLRVVQMDTGTNSVNDLVGCVMANLTSTFRSL